MPHELAHLLSIPCHDDDQPLAVIFHFCYQGIDSLLAKRIFEEKKEKKLENKIIFMNL
jgi:hypothetical protein